MSLGEVSEDVYAYLQPDGSWFLNNTGFLVSQGAGAGVISVDATSTERRTRAYLDAIAAVTAEPVRTLVNTHHHGDHTHGNYLVSGATIVGHERCREAILANPIPPPPRHLDRRRLGPPGGGAAVPDLHRRRHAVVR
jgi:cyclase